MKVIQTFEITYTQFVNPEGAASPDLPSFATDPKIVKELYRAMVLGRIFDTRAITLQRTGRLGTYPSMKGQEAVSVGACSAMKKEDVFVPYYRDFAGQFVRGVKMEEILAYWGGDERGSDFKGPREDLPISICIGTQCLHAAGVATAFKLRKQPRVAVVELGDGGTSEGDFYEAINVAGVWNLPMVVVINNNQWAISVPRSQQTAAQTLAQKAIAAGIPGEQVDGNDVIAVHHVVGEAIDRARNGQGPSLIEAISYRMGDHTTVDDASRYRLREEVLQAEKLDPIARLKKFMMTRNLLTEKDDKEIAEDCQKKVEEAAANYLAIPPEPVTKMFDHLYETLPEAYEEQRNECLTSL